MRLFDRIAEKYDLLNRILSFGMDTKWRKRVVELILEVNPEKVLDLATGTGDVARLLKRKAPHLEITGLDSSSKMLEIAEKRLKDGEFIVGDAHNLPFYDRSFDAITVAFGFRNFSDRRRVLRECRRVLKRKGRLVILELLPPNTKRFTGKIYSFYLKTWVPFVGGLFSGDFHAYRYLSTSVLNFLTPDQIVEMMKEEGFEVSFEPLFFSVAGIFIGDLIW
ncbi:dimethylmenaquinone methyltransferase [Thermotoga maritima MSB8]|jgi:demethylmenaquinone methyltransferase/2-methoxy-6-polyprenyl-1,4-benzoquinol methylase|nr:bifunctional demethylmenaquinone methyltransferase/2-methoxy-6-polyprenyl-1,4-benzoquinol methylase UbiE [Thermotoga maritima]MBZ4661732.1 Ubiquinone/menaquinone biosynthesis methyltransferase UbiE [Thermotoga sp.]AGL49679.1 Ubiquinone/menaquinone biosynthesis methyltransferase UbiE [Thermotoga maritima MSB8]AKE26670.1 dimethylmenaquinone methyltransferase [Thermotoga maritima]AKE28534.1 dimethylmenaquinone methyltransferase [Thermotoga maritima MSB8]AKE30408.1 dimethylmenaquinone methyltra